MMINFSGNPHPARKTRLASTLISAATLVGVIGAMSQNAQAQESIKVAEAAKVSALAKLNAQKQSAIKPKVKVVIVTVTAKPIHRTSTVSATGANNAGQRRTTPRTNSQPAPVVRKKVVVNRPAPVRKPVVSRPVVVTPPQQPTQTTTGGSKAP